MNPPRRLRGAFGICNLREGFVEAPWRLREGFSKTRSAKASRSPLEDFVKPSFGNDSSDNDKPPFYQNKRMTPLINNVLFVEYNTFRHMLDFVRPCRPDGADGNSSRFAFIVSKIKLAQ